MKIILLYTDLLTAISIFLITDKYVVNNMIL